MYASCVGAFTRVFTLSEARCSASPLLLISSGKLTLLIPAVRLFAGVDAPWPDKEGCTSHYSEREFHMKMLNRVNLGTRVVLIVGETSALTAQEAQAPVRHARAYNLHSEGGRAWGNRTTGGESQDDGADSSLPPAGDKGRDT